MFPWCVQARIYSLLNVILLLPFLFANLLQTLFCYDCVFLFHKVPQSSLIMDPLPKLFWYLHSISVIHIHCYLLLLSLQGFFSFSFSFLNSVYILFLINLLLLNLVKMLGPNSRISYKVAFTAIIATMI